MPPRRLLEKCDKYEFHERAKDRTGPIVNPMSRIWSLLHNDTAIVCVCVISKKRTNMSQAAHGVALISMCVSLVSQCLRNHLLVDATAKRQLFHTRGVLTKSALSCYSHSMQVNTHGCFK